MCLITKQIRPIKIRKERTCYKLVWIPKEENNVKSIYNPFKYMLGLLYETELKYINADHNDAIAFDCKVDSYYGYRPLRKMKCNLTVVTEGFHSALEVDRFRWDSYIPYNYGIVKCTIPVGALIHLDKTGLIVSDKIIINEVVKVKRNPYAGL